MNWQQTKRYAHAFAYGTVASAVFVFVLFPALGKSVQPENVLFGGIGAFLAALLNDYLPMLRK